MEITIEKIIISGRTSKTMWKLVSEGKTLFVNPDSPYQSFTAWSRKKDAKAILDKINEMGIDYVTDKLKK